MHTERREAIHWKLLHRKPHYVVALFAGAKNGRMPGYPIRIVQTDHFQSVAMPVFENEQY
jgi:hypothetical protein